MNIIAATVLLIVSQSFASNVSLIEKMRAPLELRPLKGEQTLLIRPELYGALMLRDTILLIRGTLRDYQGQLTQENTALMERVEGLLHLPDKEFLERGYKELNLSEKNVQEKSLQQPRLKEAHESWSLSTNELALSTVAALLREKLLEGVGPELFSLIESMRAKLMEKSVRVLERYNTDLINSELDTQKPTVDLDFHICEGSGFSMDILKTQLQVARQVFARNGIQLRLRSARKIRVPDTWLEISEPLVPNGPRNPSLHETDFYSALRSERISFSLDQERVFSAVVKGVPYPEKVIQIIAIRSSMVRSWDNSNGKWEFKEFPSSAVSIPGYMYGNQIPRTLRGVIAFAPMTLVTASRNPKIYPNSLAHEMGHTLINVSHEGRMTDPKHQTGLGGHRDLMVYGLGCDIPSGKSGRWQAERLLLSPFIYQMKNGKKIWNKDYQAGGYYDDPIYGSYFVK